MVKSEIMFKNLAMDFISRTNTTCRVNLEKGKKRRRLRFSGINISFLKYPCTAVSTVLTNNMGPRRSADSGRHSADSALLTGEVRPVARKRDESEICNPLFLYSLLIVYSQCFRGKPHLKSSLI